MQNGNLNLFTVPEPAFGQPAVFSNTLGQELSVFSGSQPIFGSNLTISVDKKDDLVKPLVEQSAQVSSSLAPNVDFNIKEKPKALQTSILQSENIPIRRSTRSRIPKLIPDCIMELPVKKSWPKSKRKISTDQVNSPGQENVDVPLKKFKMSENCGYGSITKADSNTVKSKKLKAKKKSKFYK